MSIESAVVTRIKSLIEQGFAISPAGKQGFALLYTEEHQIAGFCTSAMHSIEMIFGSTINAYTKQCVVIASKLHTAHLDPMMASSVKSECAGEMVSVLQSLLEDIEAGLISSLEDRISGATFDDFLDHAVEYHKQGRSKESGVIAGVVFEDSIRRIGKNSGVVNSKVENIINALASDGVLNQTKVKRAKVGAHVRNKATHAEWEQFDLRDVQDTIDITRELISTHLDA